MQIDFAFECEDAGLRMGADGHAVRRGSRQNAYAATALRRCLPRSDFIDAAREAPGNTRPEPGRRS